MTQHPKYRLITEARSQVANVLLEVFCSQASENQLQAINAQADKYGRARQEMLNSLGELRGVIHQAVTSPQAKTSKSANVLDYK